VAESRCERCGDTAWKIPSIDHVVLCADCVERPQIRSTPDPAPVDPLPVLHEAGVNLHAFKHATLPGFEVDQDAEAFGKVTDWLDAYWKDESRWPSRPWLYLQGRQGESEEIGATGNGKTHLAVALLRDLANARVPAKRMRFTTAEQILLEIEATYRNDSGDSVARLLAKYGSYDVLVIDDFGARKVTDHVARIFLELCTKRQGKATIWTSNRTIQRVARDPQMKRIVSRVLGETQGGYFVATFRGRDRRTG
jgi:hypothetical protein